MTINDCGAQPYAKDIYDKICDVLVATADAVAQKLTPATEFADIACGPDRSWNAILADLASTVQVDIPGEWVADVATLGDMAGALTTLREFRKYGLDPLYVPCNVEIEIAQRLQAMRDKGGAEAAISAALVAHVADCNRRDEPFDLSQFAEDLHNAAEDFCAQCP